VNDASEEVLRRYFVAEKERWGRRLPSVGLHAEEEYFVTHFIGGTRCSVVDMGTAGGRVAIALASMGHSPVYGFDVVPELIEYARENARLRHLDIHFDIADARSIPLPDNSVDLVIFSAALLCCLPDEGGRLRALSEARRLLRPGGWLLSSYNLFGSRWYDRGLSLLVRLHRGMSGDGRSCRSLPILRQNGRFAIRALTRNAPSLYWYRLDECVLELLHSGFMLVDMFSSSGVRQARAQDFSTLWQPGTLYVAGRVPVTKQEIPDARAALLPSG
jgi:SAM-dependent methyltransferase